MRQRLGIAAALLGDPPVLMMDEPFNGMDPEGIVWMRGFLRSLAAEGRAVLVSSHLMSELQDTADHLVVVGRGRVIADTSVADLIAAASGDRVELRTAARGRGDDGAGPRGGRGRRDRARCPHGQRPSAERIVAALTASRVPFTEVSAHRATLEEAYMELTRDAVEFRAAPARRRSGAMTTITPYRSTAQEAATVSASCCARSGPSSARCAAGSSADRRGPGHGRARRCSSPGQPAPRARPRPVGGNSRSSTARPAASPLTRWGRAASR